jgi:hypothetical protein
MEKTCTTCGVSLRPYDTYCSICGSKVNDNETGSTNSSENDTSIEKMRSMARKAGCTEKEVNKTKEAIEAIAETLDPDESIYHSMTAQMVRSPNISMNWTFIIVTNKRIYFAGNESMSVFRTIVTGTIELDKIQSISSKTNGGTYSMVVATADTKTEFDFIGNTTAIGRSLINGFGKAVRKAKEQKADLAQRGSISDEILKFKNLLDIGAITELEYEEIKQKLIASIR